MRISYSAIETYKQCPLKFKFQEIDKIRVSKSKEAVFGTLIHNALRFMHSKSPLFPSVQEVLDFFSGNYKNVNKTIWGGEFENKIYLEDGLKIIENYYKKNPPWQSDVIDLETNFAIEIKNDEDNSSPADSEQTAHILVGKIDRIDKIKDGVFEIIDYKTAKKMPPQKDVDENLQLSIYRMGIQNRWPNIKFDEVKLSLYFLRHGEKITTSRTDDEMAETKNQILAVISEIGERLQNGSTSSSQENFPAMPSMLCDWCGYKSQCPMWSHKDKKIETPDDEKIKQVVGEYFEIKSIVSEKENRLDELKDLLNAYCDANKIERVFGDGGYITRSLTAKYEYDFEKLKEILEPIKKWDEAVKIDQTKLNRLLKILPKEIANRVATLKQKSKETRMIIATANKNKMIEENEEEISLG